MFNFIGVSMTEESVNQIIEELNRIRKWRSERGNLFFDAVLEASKSIKEKYGKWYERAIDELFKEIELMNELVPYEELDEQKLRLEKLRDKFVRNKRDVDEFVAALERRDIKSFEELEVGEIEEDAEILSLPTPESRAKNFSVVLEAIRIAKEIEDIEKSIEKISRFMRNTITLARRIR